MAKIINNTIYLIFIVLLLYGCSQPPPKEPPGAPAFERVATEEVPAFEDDLDVLSLRTAIEKSLVFLERIPADRTYAFGEAQIRADKIKDSLLRFLKLVEEKRLDRRSILDAFDVYRAYSMEKPRSSLVTGYYEPVLEGRLQPGEGFFCPLYGLPPDLLSIELAAFDPERFSKERLIGRLQGNRVVPYYTRAEIDGKKSLEQKGCQVAWLKDPVDAFFLHIQGSGMLRLPGGEVRRLGYAGGNGRPYRSVGKYLLDKGTMGSEEVTLQSIRTYLRKHPEVRDEVLWHNESYVFFRWVEDGPLGSLNVPLTAGRSIATDTRYHPSGALAFLEAEKPRLDADGKVLGWEPLHRWVLNQDTGGAIKGLGRVDLFCGTGEGAEGIAGRLKNPGKLYFLVTKE